MDDADTVASVAAEMVRRYGVEASPYLRDRAEIAAGLGDGRSAETWTDIADAAERLLV